MEVGDSCILEGEHFLLKLRAVTETTPHNVLTVGAVQLPLHARRD
jgi:hypothetical protein